MITDQNAIQYWPRVGRIKPAQPKRLDRGLTYARLRNAAMPPSRATLFTGLYQTQHGVRHALTPAVHFSR
jgi:arylsulfatase A-like enzyme